MNVVLRDAADTDSDFLFELYRATREAEMASWGWGRDQEDSFLRLQFTARQQSYAAQFPDARDSVILLDGQMIGRMLVAELPDEIRLVDIAIFPAAQRKGAGTTLIKGLLESAAFKGKPVRLHVGIFNPAKELYARLGFRTLHEDGGNFLMEYS